jgi:hypothetical protein
MNLERKAGAKTFEIFLLLTKGTVEIWPIHKTCHLLCWHIFGYYLPNPAVTTNFPHTPSYRGCNYLHMCLFLQIEYKVSRAGFSLSISSLILESHKLLKMPQVGEICTWSLNRSFFFFFSEANVNKTTFEGNQSSQKLGLPQYQVSSALHSSS